SILQAVIGLFQFFKQSSLGLSWLGEYIAPIGTPGVASIDFHSLKILRAYGTLPHPNILGAFLVFGLFIGLYYVSRETFVKKLLVSCGTTVILLGIIASFSRSAWLIAIFGLVSFTLYNLYRKNLSAVPVIVLILLVSCGTFFITSGKLVKSRVSELNASSTSITLREGFNRMSFDLIKTSPILGVGIGNYIPNLQSAYSLQPWQYQPPHNIFLFILAETGILGLFSFCLMLYFVISSTWNFKKDILTFGLLGIFVGFLALGMFDHYLVTIQQGQLMFFTLIGIILAQQNNSITYAPTQKNNS
ncbi:MAG: O-antigen ligase family protein, partial [Acidobacteriaceae bacterium]